MKTTRRALATSAAVLATVLAAALPACAQSEAAPRNLSFRHLTAEEYGADYDSLLAVIRAIDSFHLVNQQLKGLDFEAETARFRVRIADFEGPGEYIRLVRQTLNLLHDNHASIVLGADEVWAASHAPEDTAVARRAAAYYDTFYTRHVTNQVPAIELPLRYISGRYTTYHRFTVDGVPVDSGFTVTAVNGRDPQTVIDTEYARIPDLLWDRSRARLYTEKILPGGRPVRGREDESHLRAGG